MVDEDDEIYREVRGRFIRGEVATIAATSTSKSDHWLTDKLSANSSSELPFWSDGARMFQRLDKRVRSVLVRACRRGRFIDHGSMLSAVNILDVFEMYLVSAFGAKDQLSVKMDNSVDVVLSSVLLERPREIAPKNSTNATRKSRGKKKTTDGEVDDTKFHHFDSHNVKKVQFLFESTSSKGGFHRLLLHAVCRYHGLRGTSATVRCDSGGVVGEPPDSFARALTVKGPTCLGGKFRIVDYAIAPGGNA